jgi:nitrate/nitrite transporter NarK
MTPASTPTELQPADLLQPLKIATTLQNDFSLPTGATFSPNQLLVQSLTDDERNAVTRLVVPISADHARSARSPDRSHAASQPVELSVTLPAAATVDSRDDFRWTGNRQPASHAAGQPPAEMKSSFVWPQASATTSPSQAESRRMVPTGPTGSSRAGVEQADWRPGKSTDEKRNGLVIRNAEDLTNTHAAVDAPVIPVVATMSAATTPIAALHATSVELIADDESPTAAPSAESLLLAVLNRAIRTPDFFAKANFSGLQLEREASRLAAQDPAARTADQTQRMNRLILESVYGKSLRKYYGAGWRPMMMLYGGVGLLVGGLLFFVCRNRPGEHPLCNPAEVDLIGSDLRNTVQTERTALPIRAILTNRSLWLCCACQWFTNVGWVLVLTWAPRYFETVHNVPIQERALMVSIPPLVGWAGMLLGGALTDRLVGLLGLQWGRILPMSGSRFLAMGAYLVCMFEPSPWVAVAMLSIVSFATDLGTPPIWAYNQDVGGRHVASILGWGNMWGNLGAAVASSLVIWIAVEQSWTAAFGACAVAFFLAGITSAGINATRPLVAEGPAAAK